MSKRFKLFWAGMALILFGVLVISWFTLTGVIAILLGFVVIEPLYLLSHNFNWSWPRTILLVLSLTALSLLVSFVAEVMF